MLSLGARSRGGGRKSLSLKKKRFKPLSSDVIKTRNCKAGFGSRSYSSLAPSCAQCLGGDPNGACDLLPRGLGCLPCAKKKKRERNRFPKNNKLEKKSASGSAGRGRIEKTGGKKKTGKEEETGVIGSWSRRVEGGREKES